MQKEITGCILISLRILYSGYISLFGFGNHIQTGDLQHAHLWGQIKDFTF